MKKIIIYSFVLISISVWMIGCKKQNYPGGEVSPYLPIFDLRGLYKGSDITLSPENMYGSSSISAVVVSDHSGKNLPAGLLIVQDKKRLSQLRGIAIPIGADAAKYVPGDSVVINVTGGVLGRVDGILQIKGISPGAVNRVAQNKPIAKNRVPSSFILADPNKYESTLLAIVKGGFNPLPTPTDVLSGNKTLNDGFADITLHTEATATFANNPLQFSANYYGILFNKVSSTGTLIPEHRMRTASDVITLSSTPEIPDFIISGWIPDPRGTNANNNYIQFIATRDINFAVTPFSVVTTNNAGASTPAGFPANGWATGGLRTYKFNLTTGSVRKGGYFYVGGTGRTINSTGSTPIPTAQYIRGINYSTTAGDGFGAITNTLLANSGNAYGIAAFRGTTVTATTRPIDVVFVHNGGSLFTPGPPAQGYRIANNDFYDVYDPLEVDPADPNKGFQPFYLQGTNTIRFNYHDNSVADLGWFYKAGGIYSVTLGKWVKARDMKYIILPKDNSPANMSIIEDDNIVLRVNAATGVEIGRDTIPPTRIR
ncbi:MULTISPECIES: DUF5689 domain-containing protein [Pedobacter]|uniref:DUF5689 domain-containing protein n=1 Tax=Pedobacter agri TaxID=454586 RepID=A0A9X3DE05_9SPHI|nr:MULTISPECIES: DUF5689 domain-containing protein [Pedobacter]MCX3265411.1 DUF5689 domain-containing protein [Pedobacter agri]